MLNVKVGDLVQVVGFTGIKLTLLPVSEVTKEEVTVIKKNGDEMIFDVKTGKQTNAANPKYANSITAEAKKAAASKKAKKAAPPVEAEEEDDEELEAPAKKAPAKKAAPVEDEDDEDFDDEEFDEI